MPLATHSLLIFNLHFGFSLLAIPRLYFSASSLGGRLSVEQTASTLMAILLFLPHLPELFELHDLIVLGPSILAAQVVNQAVFVLVVHVLASGQLGVPLDFIEDYLYENIGLVIIEISQLYARLQILFDVADHLLVHLNVRLHQLFDHHFCLLVDSLILCHQLLAELSQQLLILNQAKKGRPSIHEFRPLSAVVLFSRSWLFFIHLL